MNQPFDLVVHTEGDGPLSDADVRRWLEVVLHDAGCSGAVEVGVHWTSPAAIRALNNEHRSINEPTDVLSFPVDGVEELPAGVPRMLGDLVICAQVVEAMVREGTAIEGETDLERALARCLVHGTLHLLGMHHDDDSARAHMREREDRLLGSASGGTTS